MRPLTIDGLGNNPLLKHNLNKGKKYEKNNKYKDAINEYKKCFSYPGITKPQEIAANILIGNCYYYISNIKEAENQYKSALEISEQLENKEERFQVKSIALGNIGNIYSDKGDLEEALKYLNESLFIAREIEYSKVEANSLNSIGNIYSAQGNLGEALKYYEEALVIHREIGYRLGEAISLGNIGDLYSKKGELDKALKYLKESLVILEKCNLMFGRTIIKNNILEIQNKVKVKSTDDS